MEGEEWTGCLHADTQREAKRVEQHAVNLQVGVDLSHSATVRITAQQSLRMFGSA